MPLYLSLNIACSTLCLGQIYSMFLATYKETDKNQPGALGLKKMSVEYQRSSFNDAKSTAQQSLAPSTSFCPVLSRQNLHVHPRLIKKSRTTVSTDMALEGPCRARAPRLEFRRTTFCFSRQQRGLHACACMQNGGSSHRVYF